MCVLMDKQSFFFNIALEKVKGFMSSLTLPFVMNGCISFIYAGLYLLCVVFPNTFIFTPVMTMFVR